MLIIWLLFLRHFVKLFTLLKWHKFSTPTPRPLSVWFPPLVWLKWQTHSPSQTFVFTRYFYTITSSPHLPHLPTTNICCGRRTFWFHIICNVKVTNFLYFDSFFFFFLQDLVCKMYTASFSLPFFYSVREDVLCLEEISGRESKNHLVYVTWNLFMLLEDSKI